MSWGSVGGCTGRVSPADGTAVPSRSAQLLRHRNETMGEPENGARRHGILPEENRSGDGGVFITQDWGRLPTERR